MAELLPSYMTNQDRDLQGRWQYKSYGKGWWVSQFYGVWGDEMVAPSPSYMTQRGETVEVFSAIS